MTELVIGNFSKTLPYVPIVVGCCAILYKMNGCGWCERMKPVWEELDKTVGFLQLFTFTVDASTANMNHWKKIKRCLKNSSELEGFPLVMLYNKNGRVVLYPGYCETEEMRAKMIEFCE
jgi:thioredoxin-related protein